MILFVPSNAIPMVAPVGMLPMSVPDSPTPGDQFIALFVVPAVRDFEKAAMRKKVLPAETPPAFCVAYMPKVKVCGAVALVT